MHFHLTILLRSRVSCTVCQGISAITRASMILLLFTSQKSEEEKTRNKTKLSYLHHNASLSALVAQNVIFLTFHVALYYYKRLFNYWMSICHVIFSPHIVYITLWSYWSLQLAWQLSHDNLVVGAKFELTE